MRILLKRGTKYLTIYYIKRRKGNNCIVGWFSGKQLLPKLFPEINTLNSDIHFTYFADGNYHVSLKYTDSTNDKIERRLFYDKIVIKNITKGSTQTLPKNGISVFDGHLVPNFRPAAFSDSHLCFQTVLTAFTLSNEQLYNEFDNLQVQATNPKRDDLIIDIEAEKKYLINASANLTGSDFIQPPITNPNFTFEKILFLEDKIASPYIKLQVMFHLSK